MTKKLLLVVTITIIAGTIGWGVAVPLASPETERAQLKVVKVFSARDGDAVFQEYLVNWKDQEVVVRDPLIQTDYHTGDTITVLVIRNKYPHEQPGPELLSFLVVPH